MPEVGLPSGAKVFFMAWRKDSPDDLAFSGRGRDCVVVAAQTTRLVTFDDQDMKAGIPVLPYDRTANHPHTIIPPWQDVGVQHSREPVILGQETVIPYGRLMGDMAHLFDRPWWWKATIGLLGFR